MHERIINIFCLPMHAYTCTQVCVHGICETCPTAYRHMHWQYTSHSMASWSSYMYNNNTNRTNRSSRDASLCQVIITCYRMSYVGEATHVIHKQQLAKLTQHQAAFRAWRTASHDTHDMTCDMRNMTWRDVTHNTCMHRITDHII